MCEKEPVCLLAFAARSSAGAEGSYPPGPPSQRAGGKGRATAGLALGIRPPPPFFLTPLLPDFNFFLWGWLLGFTVDFQVFFEPYRSMSTTFQIHDCKKYWILSRLIFLFFNF